MTIGTAPLTTEATWREIDAMIAFLNTLGVSSVEITYGWGCKAAGIEQPVLVPLGELLTFLQIDIAKDIYHLGEDNLYIGVTNPALTFTLCHDADIHFDATASELETRLRAEWEARGVRVWPEEAVPKDRKLNG
jgi:hypothetical protein